MVRNKEKCRRNGALGKTKAKKWELAVTEFFPAEAKILDVGCGLGREAFVLSDMGYKVTGIDISQEVIDQVVPFSVQKGYDIPFSVYDGHKLPLKRILLTSLSYGRRPLVYYMAMNTSMNFYWNVSVF